MKRIEAVSAQPRPARLPTLAKAHSQRFYALSGPDPKAPSHPPRQVCFTLTTLSSFCLQGIAPHRDPTSSPRPRLPCRWTRQTSCQPLGFEGLLPLRSGRSQSYSDRAMPSWRFPLGGAPFRCRRTGFPTPPLTRLEGKRPKSLHQLRPRVSPNSEPVSRSLIGKNEHHGTGLYGVCHLVAAEESHFYM